MRSSMRSKLRRSRAVGRSPVAADGPNRRNAFSACSAACRASAFLSAALIRSTTFIDDLSPVQASPARRLPAITALAALLALAPATSQAFDPATNSWSILPSMPMPRHGVAGAMIGNKFHLVSGMITSAAAGAGQDRTVEVHVAQHDVLELPASGTN